MHSDDSASHGTCYPLLDDSIEELRESRDIIEDTYRENDDVLIDIVINYMSIADCIAVQGESSDNPNLANVESGSLIDDFADVMQDQPSYMDPED